MVNLTNATLHPNVENLSHPDQTIRRQTRQALIAIGEPAIPPLVRLLDSPDYLARWEAVEALGNIDDPKVTKALVKSLEDTALDIRCRAAEWLVLRGHSGLEAVIEALRRNPTSLALRDGTLRILRGLSARQTLIDTVSQVEDMFDDNYQPKE